MLGGGPDAATRDALDRWGVPGAVVGVLAGGKTDVRSYGMTDLADGEPIHADMSFRVASITKPFTAALAVILAEEGLLSLDEPVPLALPNEGITLAHLLSHLAGLASEAGDLARFGEGDDALDRVVDELAGVRPLAAPGEAWSYSNAGYWAGLLCARAAGLTYEHALSARVLEPLGLAATHFGAPDARGHVQSEPGSHRHEPAPPDAFARARRPGGGLVSTAHDLLRFAAVSSALLEEFCGVRHEPPPTAALEARELVALAGRYANADLEATVAVDGAGLAIDPVAIDPSGGRTVMPRIDARPIGGRTFAVVGGQWEGDRFDFLPEDGPPRFARIGWSLLPRC